MQKLLFYFWPVVFFLADDTALKSGRRKVQMEEMAYIRGKNDINRHIRYGNNNCSSSKRDQTGIKKSIK